MRGQASVSLRFFSLKIQNSAHILRPSQSKVSGECAKSAQFWQFGLSSGVQVTDNEGLALLSAYCWKVTISLVHYKKKRLKTRYELSDKIVKKTENNTPKAQAANPFYLWKWINSTEYIRWLLCKEKFWSAWESKAECYSHSFDFYSPPPYLGILKQMKEGIIPA